MKSNLRIAVGVVLFVALVVFAYGTVAFAQSPTGNSALNPTDPTATASPTTAIPGPTSTVSLTTTAQLPACTDVATFVTDVTIPDHTVAAPGQAFAKTWRVRNTGTCVWGPGYGFALVAGQAMSSVTSIAVPETKPVTTVDLSVAMTAPTVVGSHQGFWQLRSPSGKDFGPRVWVLVNVGTGAPAAAPPPVPGGLTLDDPVRATLFGSAIPSVPAGSAVWVRFAYDNGGNALPRPTVTIQLLNGVLNGLGFQVYSPETMVDGWSNNKPAGRGTAEMLGNCNAGGDNGGNCATNNLSWTGGFGLSAAYYVRVINSTGSAVTPQIIISGAGLAQ
jgi:hypothetical protein